MKATLHLIIKLIKNIIFYMNAKKKIAIFVS